MKNKSREQRNNRLGSVSSSTPNIKELEIIRVENPDKRAFNILCASRDLTQTEMFHELIEFYHRGQE
jgi:hypothetical protein